MGSGHGFLDPTPWRPGAGGNTPLRHKALALALFVAVVAAPLYIPLLLLALR